MRLGIDFGTTRTVVACADRGNYPVLTFCDAAGDAYDWFPSVVAERDGELRFGFDALATANDPSFTAVRSFKRLLADLQAGPGKEVTVGTSTLAIDDLVTQFLGAMKEAVLTRSNLPENLRAEPVVRSVVAVPANSSGAQRFITLDAFRRAGLAPALMLNEPSAAGFEYTHRHRDTLTTRRDHVVVYDLGGGTFDASLVRMRGRAHEIMATAGVNRLGGDDFDDVLLKLVLERAQLERARIEPRALERLLDQCRDAKERLNPSSRKISIDLETALGAEAPMSMVVLTVADFYAACTPLVERSMDAMAPLMARLHGNASSDADTRDMPEDIAGIYVVGGASELPIVARALRERFGRRVHRSPYPSAAIAIGLAIACDDGAAFELADRCSRTFGVFREGREGSAITFDPIFASGTALPSRSGDRVLCRRDYRAAHNVGHFRFFECDAVTADGHPHGDMMVSGDILFPFDTALATDAALAVDAAALRDVPVRRMGARGPRIEEQYALDDNGIVAITIRNVDAGFERVYTLGSASPA